MSDSELTLRERSHISQYFEIFSGKPQQHVSSLHSIEMTSSRFDLAYIELTLN
mgnify:CR=1 FL=1